MLPTTLKLSRQVFGVGFDDANDDGEEENPTNHSTIEIITFGCRATLLEFLSVVLYIYFLLNHFLWLFSFLFIPDFQQQDVSFHATRRLDGCCDMYWKVPARWVTKSLIKTLHFKGSVESSRAYNSRWRLDEILMEISFHHLRIYAWDLIYVSLHLRPFMITLSSFRGLFSCSLRWFRVYVDPPREIVG